MTIDAQHARARRAGAGIAMSRVIALVIAICFILTFALTGVFILTHAEHEHDHGEVCSDCARIQGAADALKRIGALIAGALSAAAGMYAAVALVFTAAISIMAATPVALKMRMNN